MAGHGVQGLELLNVHTFLILQDTVFLLWSFLFLGIITAGILGMCQKIMRYVLTKLNKKWIDLSFI